MRTLRVFSTSAALLCVVGGCQPQSEQAANVEADVAAIRELFAGNAAVINANDLDGWVSQFTEDAVFMPQGSPVLKGRAAGREFARPWYEQFHMEFEVSVDEIEVHGDWAFARWSYVGRYTPKAGGATTEDVGKEIWILKRQSDGSWQCSHIIYNSDSA
jgi:uncharacterized protein (TIGR02246 family)